MFYIEISENENDPLSKTVQRAKPRWGFVFFFFSFTFELLEPQLQDQDADEGG